MSTVKANRWEKVNGTVINVPLQVLSSVKSDTASFSGATWIDVVGLSVTITPSSATSKFLILYNVHMGQSLQYHLHAGRIVRNGNPIFIANADGSRERCTFGCQDSGTIHGATYNYAGQFLDSPSTLAALTYKIQVRGEGGTTFINRGNEADGDNSVTQRLISSITIMEIAA